MSLRLTFVLILVAMLVGIGCVSNPSETEIQPEEQEIESVSIVSILPVTTTPILVPVAPTFVAAPTVVATMVPTTKTDIKPEVPTLAPVIPSPVPVSPIPNIVKSPAPTSYHLKLLISGNGSITPPIGEYVYKAESGVDVSATPDSGWRLLGWSINDEPPNPYYEKIMMYSDMVATAVFSDKELNESIELYSKIKRMYHGVIPLIVCPSSITFEPNTSNMGFTGGDLLFAHIRAEAAIQVWGKANLSSTSLDAERQSNGNLIVEAIKKNRQVQIVDISCFSNYSVKSGTVTILANRDYEPLFGIAESGFKGLLIIGTNLVQVTNIELVQAEILPDESYEKPKNEMLSVQFFTVSYNVTLRRIDLK